jgi:hypothetical protein
MRSSKTVLTIPSLVGLLIMVVVFGAVAARGSQGTSGRKELQSHTPIQSRRASDSFDRPSKLDVDSAAARLGATRFAANDSSSTREGSTSGHNDQPWRSEDLSMLGIGMAVGDVDGDGNNDIVLIDPSTVYLYRLTGGKLSLVTQYSAGSIELKSVDVASVSERGPKRIYVSAQNRGNVSSFVLEYRNGTLIPVIQEVPYFLRVLIYPTHGPILLGQRKSMQKMYDGPIVRLTDKGDRLEEVGRFGVPLKIPVFGFAIGDLAGDRKPLIAVYDRSDHLRVYRPDGHKLYVSQDYYGGSDVPLRWSGIEHRAVTSRITEEEDSEFYRPRIMSLDLDGHGKYQVLAIKHHSMTRRLLSRTKMLEEGSVRGLVWNGEALEERWSTPKLAGEVTDFAVDNLPGIPGLRLITLERKKTDWLSFLRSRSQIRAYDLRAVMAGGASGKPGSLD